MTVNERFRDLTADISNAMCKLLDEKDDKKKSKIYSNLNDMFYNLDKIIILFKLLNNVELNRKEEWEKCLNYLKDIKEIFTKELCNDIRKEDNIINSNEIYKIYFEKFAKIGESLYFDVRMRYPNRYQYIIGESLYSDTPEEILNTATEEKTKLIKHIINAQEKKRIYNILFSNLEYNLNLLHNMSELDTRKYATYSNTNFIKKENRLLLEKVAIGGNRDYLIRNSSFDIIWHRARTDKDGNIDATFNDNIKPTNITYDTKRLYKYLRKDGVLLYEIPLELLFVKEILEISNYYSIIDAYLLPQKNYDINYVCLALRRNDKPTPEEKERTYQFLRCLSIDSVTPIENLDFETDKEKWKLSLTDYGPINLFKGSEIDELLLEIAFNRSTLKNKIFSEEKDKILKPLLPLKKGQIGQIIASGELDGIIDEGNGFKHVIRGRVCKAQTHSFEETKNGLETVQTDHNLLNNIVEINAYAGDGTFKCITISN